MIVAGTEKLTKFLMRSATMEPVIQIRPKMDAVQIVLTLIVGMK